MQPRITDISSPSNPVLKALKALSDKRGRREVPFEADFVGFSIPDKFVVGYGLDLDQKFRNLPYIGVFR
jgi:hypoxanthine phosphoribosyltransferase